MLDMNNATYGRNQRNSVELKTTIEMGIESLMHNLTGPKYADLRKEIDRYWNGADKDKFVAHIEEQIGKIRNGLNTIRTYAGEAIDQDYKNFVTAQNTHYKK